MKKSIFICWIILYTFLLASCTGGNTTPSVTLPSPSIKAAASPEVSLEPILYRNEKVGYSLLLPGNWKDNFIVDGGTFYFKKVREKLGYDGKLFTILQYKGELWTKEDAKNLGPNGTLLLQGNGYSYILRTPTDYQGSDDKTLAAEFDKMHDQRESIYKTIALLKAEPPKAENAGYKVVGGRFFTAEIPQEWTIKALTTKALSWDMSSGGAAVGSIDILPFNAEKVPSDNKTMREYLSTDSKKLSCVRISLLKEKADQTVMDKIKSSFKSMEMFYNLIVALQTEANDYLSKGGESIFGTVEPGEKGKIAVHLMKYVPDTSAKGYHIEDLMQTKVFEEKGQKFVPLVGGVLKTYIEEYCFFSDFVKAHSNYSNFYFDMIIYNGELKMAFERKV